MQCISRKDQSRSRSKDRRELGEEAVLTNGENGNCDVGNNHKLWCGQKVSEHVVVVKRFKGRFGCGINI